MKNCYFKKFVCLLLIVVLAFQLVIISATASETVFKFTVNCDDKNYTLHLIQVNNEWYVKATDLASLGQTVIKESDTSVSFYKKTPSVLLHTVNSNECREYNSSKYVHLQKTSIKIGVRFYLHGNTPKAEVLKSPQQLFAEVKTVFSDTRLPLSQVTSSIIYKGTECAARVWAAMPFVGSGSIIGALTGKDEYDRYLDVMTTMISDGGDISDFLSTTADFNDNMNKYTDVINKAIKFSKKGSTLYNFLKSKGISDQIINTLIYEYNPYEQNLEDFFNGYTDVAKIVNLKYFLDLSAYYASVVDMDESTLLCMQKVFGNSSNRHAKNATESAVDLRFGKGYIAMSDIVGGVVGDIIINSIDKALEKKLSGGSDDIIGLGTFVYDKALHISDISDATIYLSICASLQNDIIKYYNSHKNESAYDMRAIALMYLKTTLVAYDYLEFDKDLAGTVQIAKQTINSYLDVIFDYAKTEYAPNYDNSAIINYLNKHINELGTSTEEDDFKENSVGLKIGDHVYFGSASTENKPDIWQVINIDGDYALIYNMYMYKGVFDASIHAQTNTISLMRYHTYGSVSWEHSNLRSWLNSRDAEVAYQDVVFDYSNTGIATVPWDSNGSPTYTFATGYLSEERFTKEEYYLIQPVTHKNLIPWPESGMDSVMDVKFGDFSDDLSQFYKDPYGTSTTTDMMFPLNGFEFKEYVLDNNLCGFKYPNGNSLAPFWLRDSVDTDFAGFYGYYGTHALTVSNGKASSNQADLNSAIRPACYIDMRYIDEVTGTGSFEDPYRLAIDSAVVNRVIEEYSVTIGIDTSDDNEAGNEHICFGQMNGQDLSWEVIDRNGDIALLLCDNIIDSVSMGNMSSYQYGTSPLKKWCDDFYLSDCFTEDERGAILEQSIDSNDGNHLFVLSLSEFEKYFPTTEGRERPPLFENEPIYWWLRTTSQGSVYIDLSSFEPGKSVCAPNIQTRLSTFGICPAVYVDLSLLPDSSIIEYD